MNLWRLPPVNFHFISVCIQQSTIGVHKIISFESLASETIVKIRFNSVCKQQPLVSTGAYTKLFLFNLWRLKPLKFRFIFVCKQQPKVRTIL